MNNSSRALAKDDFDWIVNVLASQAFAHPVSPQIFFRYLVQSADLPLNFKEAIVGIWTGSVESDARNLVNWAVGKGGNPIAPKYTILGSLIAPLLPSLGIEDARHMAAEIIAYSLYRDEILLSSLMDQYHIPYPARLVTPITDLKRDYIEPGPDFSWYGTTDHMELQSFLRPEPDYQDVGFLIRAIERAACVCAIELPASLSRGGGTGFLIAKTLVLTCFHVLKYTPQEDMNANAAGALLRFGKISTAAGQPAEGYTFKLAANQPIIKSSPADELDYALLRVEDAITTIEQIKSAPYTTQLPARGTGLNILQHPRGQEMKIALSNNGVVEVYPERGLVQYVTRAQGGSSGSPCFNDDWQVIALHHAEKSRAFGLVREGITFERINTEIAAYL